MLGQVHRPGHGASRSHCGILGLAYLAHAIWHAHLHPAILLRHHSLARRDCLLPLVVLLHHLLLLHLLELRIRNYNLSVVRILVTTKLSRQLHLEGS
jgi:hypothetical protein